MKKLMTVIGFIFIMGCEERARRASNSPHYGDLFVYCHGNVEYIRPARIDALTLARNPDGTPKKCEYVK